MQRPSCRGDKTTAAVSRGGLYGGCRFRCGYVPVLYLPDYGFCGYAAAGGGDRHSYNRCAGRREVYGEAGK